MGWEKSLEILFVDMEKLLILPIGFEDLELAYSPE